MSNLKVNTINDASGGSNAVLYGVASPPNSMGFRNRIINGDMRIDQRNAGASVTPTSSGYTLDRWSASLSVASKYSVQQNAGSVTPPAGFTNYLGVTSTSAYSISTSDFFLLEHNIEGFNTADFAWGTVSAQAITMSFWIRSSLTGTFGGALVNSGQNRSYPFTYTISSANTWEQKTITVAGDTSGTWVTNNGVGIRVRFGIGVGSTISGTAGAWAASNFLSATGATSVVGTSGATFYITGVQLEAGTVASPFERRDYGRELIMCQRYFEVSYDPSVAVGGINSNGQFAWVNQNGQTNLATCQLKVIKRTAPTITLYSPANGTSGNIYNGTTSVAGSVFSTGVQNFAVLPTSSQVLCNLTAQWAASAEL